MMEYDTIAAIATPIGTAGISIVKISGPGAIEALERVFRAKNPKRDIHHISSQSMVYGHVYDPGSGELVDEVLASVLRGPNSFTGEDVVEINCHGGIQVTKAVLEILMRGGLRMADPGEFTRRAFLNGRIDLTQVEGTIDLIHARTRRAAQLGSQMLAHGIGDEIRRLGVCLKEVRTLVEADIDFCDDLEEECASPQILKRIEDELIPGVANLVMRYHDGRILREGLRVVLTGKPNVGKSSLMNKLLDQERVIVTDIPGTTRDIIEEGIVLDGMPIMLCDTAGLHNSDDPIDRIGQSKTKEALQRAELILFMMDGSQATDGIDREIFDSIRGREYVVLRNKVDLVPDSARRSILDEMAVEEYLDISALNGTGLERLKERIKTAAHIDESAEAEALLPNQRQWGLLTKGLSSLKAAIQFEKGMQCLDIVAFELGECERCFNQILGENVETDVLDDIFRRFCIGK